ncbi:MAG: hypothetical protein QNJ73_10215 [Gammaproteobacteria bacterium]|nr:hypothetical protein [Gammaproteobacteria bacterium]
MHSVRRLRKGFLLVACAFCLISGTASADVRDQARRIHDRLAGVPPSQTVLDTMEQDIINGGQSQAAYESAAYTAMQNSEFYKVTLKNFAAPWTNRDFDVFVPLNDYVATVIGIVRDDDQPGYVPFNELLSADVLYVGAGNLGLPAYSAANNNHYAQMERDDVDLGDPLQLVRDAQTVRNGIPAAGVAGVLTTRAAAEAFFVAGTNRAMFRFTMVNHLCNDMEQMLDTTRAADRIRQDVSRSPGGDSRVYLTNCIGCHSGMDPLAQAYAYHDYDDATGRLVYTPGTVVPKYFNNDTTFQYGFVTPDDSWDNYWRDGPNNRFEWDFGPNTPGGSGSGAASMGRELANSKAFARCQAKKVFRAVCLRDPADANDAAQIESMTVSFRDGGYRLKQVFAESAVYCMGD